MATTEELAAMQSYGVTPARDMQRLQREANEAAESRFVRSSLASMTFETAVGDANEALSGLMADLSGTTERHSLRDMLMHEDRMRGLGILFIALALVGLVVDYIMVP